MAASPSGVTGTTTTMVRAPWSQRASDDHFMGGMGGRGGAHNKKEIDNTKYYTLLGVTKENNTDEIKKAFRKIALKEHPDKGGDPEKVGSLRL